MIQTYYTYKDLADMLNQDVRTIKRKISKMNIKKRRFGGKGTPFFLGLDIHSFMLFNQPFDRLNANDKQQVKELIVNAAISNL